jgi:crotonobetainyl-CoA:carnitine CoA-transferase CaiB-like acyl-CoA transferase
MIALAAGNDKQFAKLAELLGHPEWAEDERLKTNTARILNRAFIDGLLEQQLQSYVSDELIALCRANGIPIGRVNTVKQALAMEQTAAKQMILEIKHPTIDHLKTLASPLKMFGTPNSVRYAPPLLGEHTDEILTKYLHLSKAELIDLKNKKVIN